KAWAVERRDRYWRELQARRSENAEEKKKQIARQKEEKPETDGERPFDLELEAEDLAFQGSKAIRQQPSTDLDLARAMEEAIDYYERLDRLEKDALAKRVVILEQIRLHDEALHIRVLHYCKYVEAVEGEREMMEMMEMLAREEREKDERAKQEKERKGKNGGSSRRQNQKACECAPAWFHFTVEALVCAAKSGSASRRFTSVIEMVEMNAKRKTKEGKAAVRT